MSIEAITCALLRLSSEDRRTLATWLYELDYDAWDKQMAEDVSPGGRGAHLIYKVKQEIAARRCISPFKDFSN